MEKTLALFTDIIKGEVCNATVSLSALSLDEAKALFRLSKRHELAHIVGNAVCREGVLSDEKAKAAFEKESFTALYRYEAMEKELVSLSTLFAQAALPFMPLKGAVIRAYYPAPWMRNSCDIDILVKKEDISRAQTILLEHGYSQAGEGTHDISFNSKAGVHLELHYCLIEDKVLSDVAKLLDDPWRLARPTSENAYRYEMTDAAFYLYHIAHMAKHYLLGGCGIRPFLDLWVLTHLVPHDKDARASLLADAKLLSFAEAAEALAEAWFGDGEHSLTTKDMERVVLKGGVYGTTENRVSVQQVKRGGKLRYALSRIFLSIEVLKYHYPVLKKHKWLYPVCQVRRWFRLVFGGSLKHSVYELRANASLSAEDAEGTRAHLQKLGF